MKRKLCLTMALCLLAACFAPAALAEEERSFSGALAPRDITTLTAPYTGRVLTVSGHVGELIAKGSELFTLDTTKVYAPCDGTVAGLFAAVGDSLADIGRLYAAPLSIEPSAQYIINGSASGAYNANENKYVHVGESVHLYCSSSDERDGTGVVTSVSGSAYTVEVRAGSLRLSDNCYISRGAERDESKQRIGSGRVQRNLPVAVTAEGSVLALHVAEGATVKKGELLMETVTGDLRGGVTDARVLATADCVLLSVDASVGTSVQQGQALCTAYAVGALEAVVTVDESDLSAIAIGNAARIELDGAPDREALTGTVRAIAYTPDTNGSGVAYNVYVSFENDAFVRQGMSVTVVIGHSQEAEAVQ